MPVPLIVVWLRIVSSAGRCLSRKVQRFWTRHHEKKDLAWISESTLFTTMPAQRTTAMSKKDTRGTVPTTYQPQPRGVETPGG